MNKIKSSEWSRRARLLQTVAHPVRLLILESLSKKPRCVKDIGCIVPIEQPNLSQHIAVLKKAQLVASHISGSLRCYYLMRPALVKNLINLLKEKHAPKTRKRESVLNEIRK